MPGEVIALAPSIEQQGGIANSERTGAFPADEITCHQLLDDPAYEAVAQTDGRREILQSHGLLGIEKEPPGDARRLWSEEIGRAAAPCKPVRVTLDFDPETRDIQEHVP